MSQSYSPASYAPIETRNLKHSPKCVFYLNGDGFFPGSKLCISNRIRTFDGVKDEITKTLLENRKHPGHVRNIFTPTGGTRLRSVEDIKDGEHYVAATNDKFRPLPYREICEPPRPPGVHRKGFRKIDINRIYTPVQHAHEERLRRKSGRSYYLNDNSKGLILKVHINGMDEKAACPVSIQTKDRNDMSKIKDTIQTVLNDKVYHTPPIHRLYRIRNSGGYMENFSEIKDASELEPNEHLLVMSKHERKIQPKLYGNSGKLNFKVATSPRVGQYYLYDDFPVDKAFLRHNRSLNKLYKIVSCGGCKENFIEVCDPTDIEANDHLLVMTKKERKLRPNYYTLNGLQRFKVATSPRPGQHYLYPSFDQSDNNVVYKHNKTLNKHKLVPKIGSSSQKSDSVSPMSNPPSYGGGNRTKNKNRGPGGGRHAKDVDYDRDEGGVYRSRQQNNARGAQQVKETFETRTERPIDEMEAEIVTEEEIHTKEKSTPIPSGTELNKQPSEQNKHSDDTDYQATQTKEVMKTNDHKTEISFEEDNEAKAKANVDDGESIPDNKDERDLNDSTDRDANVNVQADGRRTQEHTPENKKHNGGEAITPTKEQGDEDDGGRFDEGNERSEEYIDESFNQFDRHSPTNKHSSNHHASTPSQRSVEAERENVQREREDEAVTRLQAGVHGQHARREFAAKNEPANERREQEEQDERERRAEEERRMLEAEQSDQDDLERQQQDLNHQVEAATKIQAGFRGHQARKQMNAVTSQVRDNSVMSDRNVREETAAIRIQASYKGYKTRRNMNSRRGQEAADKHAAAERERREDEAATHIQAGYRGFRTRKGYHSKREAISKQANDEGRVDDKSQQAATRIQAGYKGYKTRKEIRATRRPVSEKGDDGKILGSDEAASRIQAGYRGYKTRSEYAARKRVDEDDADMEHRRNAAATRIQAGYRGHQIRRKYASTRKQSEQSDGVVSKSEQEDKDLEIAATKIQAGFRGYKTRKEYIDKVKRQAFDMEGSVRTNQHSEPIAVQPSTYSKDHIKPGSQGFFASNLHAAFRGYLTRKTVHEANASDLTIQRVHAVISHSKTVRSNITNDPNSLSFYSDESVTKLQAAFNGYKSRELNRSQFEHTNQKIKPKYMTKQNHYYATKVQALCHGYITRHLAKLCESDKKHGPVLILSGPSITEMEKELSDASNDISVALSDESGKSFWEDSNVKMVSDKSQWELSSKIQSAFNSYKTRHRYNTENVNSIASQVSNDHYVESRKSKKLANCNATRIVGGEVEKEGDSFKEVEDDEGELNMMKRRFNTVLQLQAAFRGYKVRRDTTELLSGGSELVDMAKVKQDVSALKKEFRFKSGKFRRLNSFDFINKTEPWVQQWRSDNEVDSPSQNTAKSSIQAVHRTIQNSLSRAVIDNKQSQNDDLQATGSLSNKSAVSTIQTSVKGYSLRNEMHENWELEQSCSKIRAALDGFKTRKIEHLRKLKQKGEHHTDSIQQKTIINNDIPMKGDKIDKCATCLQAAFSGYQTRKMFISITEIVGRDVDSLSYSSETDDFKLRRKAAFDAHRLGINLDKLNITAKAKVKTKQKDKCNDSLASGDTSMFYTKNTKVPSKQTKELHARMQNVTNTKPDVIRGCHLNADHAQHTVVSMNRSKHYYPSKRQWSNSDLHVEHKNAATLLQSIARGYLQRLNKHDGNEKSFVKERRNSGSSTNSNKVSVKSIKFDMKRLVKTKTSSVKLEAEKRKIAAERNKQKEISLAKENTASVKRQAIKLKSTNNYWESSDKREASFVPKSILHKPKQVVTPDTNSVHTEKAALKIQKVYRGYKVRQMLKSDRAMAHLTNEYNAWNGNRNDAVVSIQSLWRGYRVRKDLKSQTNESNSESEELLDVSHSNVNIAEAQLKCTNASNVQMVFKAAQVRRTIKLKAARLRREKFAIASKIQALSRGYITRHSDRLHNMATKIQAGVKGYTIREDVKEMVDDKKSKEGIQRMAATKIQAAIKGYQCREDMKECMGDRKSKQVLQKIAATKIQASIKGYKSREDLNKIVDNRKNKELVQRAAATKIQAGVRGLTERKCKREQLNAANYIISAFRSYKRVTDTKVYKDKVTVESKAAFTIQAGYRRHLKWLKTSQGKEKERMITQKTAASFIQASVQGMFTRKQANNLQQKCSAAAVTIQSTYRAYKYRSVGKKDQNYKLKQTSALKIQATYRGYLGRKLARQQHDIVAHNVVAYIVELVATKACTYVMTNASATRIQASFSGYLTRKQMVLQHQHFVSEQHTNENDKENCLIISAAATAIQATVRADQARQEQRLRVLEKNNSAMILASFRGFMTRKQDTRHSSIPADNSCDAVEKTSNDNHYNKKVTELQSVCRAYQHRRHVSEILIRKHKAAVTIQTTIQNFHYRKMVLGINEKHQLDNATTCIQASFKGHLSRKLKKQTTNQTRETPKLIRDRHDAANTIAIAFRDLQRRKAKAASRIEM